MTYPYKGVVDRLTQTYLPRPRGGATTGLRLSINRRIVELHGGNVWVESEENRDVRFGGAHKRRKPTGMTASLRSKK